MRKAAISLWALQATASLIAVIAALTNFESILATGPTLAVTGLLLGAVTIRLGSPLVLVYALSGPIICSIGSLLIAANHWGPREADGPLTSMLVIYGVLAVPLAMGALPRIRQMPDELPSRRRFKWQFSLKSVLMLMTAVCVLITVVQLLVRYLPDYSWAWLFNSYWPGFGGFGFATLLLSAVVYRRYRALKSRNVAITVND
jgi:hypothetical protein